MRSVYSKLVFVITIIFVLHRLLAWQFLGEWNQDRWSYFIVGSASDFWIAAILAFLVLFLSNIVSVLLNKKFKCQIAIGICFVVALITALHQSYVAFFHYQIIPFHVRYLYDVEFAKANSASFLNLSSILILFVGTFGGLISFSETKKEKTATFFSGSFVILVIALIAHAVNIKYRVQWFVPETLQVNFLERLYMSYEKSITPLPLTEQEIEWLAAKLDVSSSKELKSILFKRQKPSSETQSLQAEFVNLKSRGKHPLVIVVIMESMRPSEVGILNRDSSRTSITPNLDLLAEKGVLFTRAYATGTVTRSGQEAVLCGYLSGQDISLMRSFPKAQVLCLPNHTDYWSAWLHGGEGRFDSQLDFWKSQKFQSTLTSSDFEKESPRTGWGVGDVTLIKKSMDLISQNIKQRDVFASILTVTNHIPWEIPGDADSKLLAHIATFGRQSYGATFYADYALGDLFSALKASGLWEQTFLVAVSDHGNLEPSYHSEKSTSDEQLLSHITLILGGGMTERLRSSNILNQNYDHVVSQSSVATLLSQVVADSKMPTMAADLFDASHQKSRVLSDTVHNFYVPSQNKTIPKKLLTKSVKDIHDEDDAVDILRQRLLLQFLYQGTN